MNSTAKGDIWQRARHEQTRAITDAFHRIYTNRQPQPKIRRRQPTAVEQEATTRPGDRYDTTDRITRRRIPSEIDPTLASIFKWEASVQQATTHIADAVDQIARITTTIRTRPHLGWIEPAPTAPATRITGSGNVQIDVSPDACYRYTTEAVRWLEHANTAIADLIRTDTDNGETAKAALIMSRTTTLLGVRLCRCDDQCGMPAPARGRGATRPNCRKRKQRNTKGANGKTQGRSSPGRA